MATPSGPVAEIGSAISGGKLTDVGSALAARPYARRGVSTTGDTIHVVLADDHAILRAGIKALLRGVRDIAVVGEAATGEEAVQVAIRSGADVVVMDLDMPGAGGAAATRTLVEQAPQIRVLILTMHTEQERLLGLLQDGARGYLAKDAADRELVDAIRAVAAGEVYVRPTVARLLASSIVAPAPAADTPATRFAELSERERTVLRLVAEGFNGPEIGARLGITAKTVDTYKQRIEDKLHLTHRSEYVKFALEAGLLGRAAAAS